MEYTAFNAWNSAMVAKNGMLYLTAATTLDKPGYLFAFDANTGVEKWLNEFIGSSLFMEESGAPVILGNMIYIPVYKKKKAFHPANSPMSTKN